MFAIRPFYFLLFFIGVAAAVGFVFGRIDRKRNRRLLLVRSFIIAMSVTASLTIVISLYILYTVWTATAQGSIMRPNWSGLAVGSAVSAVATFIGAVVGYANGRSGATGTVAENLDVGAALATPVEESGNPYQPPSS